MKRFVIIWLMILGLSVVAFAVVQGNRAFGRCTTEQSQKAGCCSRHGGVCGCNKDAHKLKCCDGTLSKSCGC